MPLFLMGSKIGMNIQQFLIEIPLLIRFYKSYPTLYYIEYSCAIKFNRVKKYLLLFILCQKVKKLP